MTGQQIAALAPIIILSLSAVVLMLQASVKRSRRAAWYITALGFAAAMAGAMYARDLSQQVTPLLLVDPWGLFFTLLILVAGSVTLVLSRDGLFPPSRHREEYYLLLTLAVLGAVVLVQSSHMASLLLGMELMGVALYAMIAFPEKGQLPLEAAIKYLVLSACASAMLLFGFALLYAATGDLNYSGMGIRAAHAWQGNPVLVSAGVAMVLAGLGFKLSLVPFHMWTPDVYQGAPTAVTGFLATVSKGAVFVALTRIFTSGNLAQYSSLMTALSLVAIASMLVGNWLALRQNNIKRLLSYSSIAHFGYLLVVLIASGTESVLVSETVTFYLTAYMVTTLAAFTVAALVGGEEDWHYSLNNFSGLFWRQPLQAAALSVAMLSLAGIPLTAGFLGKFYLINAGIQAALWWLLAALVAGSAIAIYYYLRVVFVMSSSAPGTAQPQRNPGSELLAALLLLAILALGIWPQPFIGFIGGL